MWKFFVTGALASLAVSVNAATIDFSALDDPRQPQFSAISEDGFDVVATQGLWREAHFFGAPVPAIFSRDDVAQLQITASDPGTFSVQSLDLGYGGLYHGSVSYVFEGLLAGQAVFETSGTYAELESWTTIGLGGATVDTLILTFDGSDAVSYNIDNIVLDLVSMPVPAGGALLLTGLGLLALRRRSQTD